MQVVAFAGVNDERLLQPAQIIIDAFHRDLAVLAFEESGDRICREGLAHILDDILHHTVKKILLVDAVTFDNITGNYGVVNAVDDLISALLIIFAKCNDGKTAEADILLQQFPAG